MNRTRAAFAASAVAILVLVALIYSSRPLSSDAYQEHYTRLNAINTGVATYTGLVEQLRLARREGVGAGSSVSILRSRVAENGQQVAAWARDEIGGSEAYRRYTGALEAVVDSASEAQTRMSEYQRSLSAVREDGPAVVQRLRDSEGGPDPQRFYGLILRVLEYGRTGEGDAAEIASRIDEVSFEDGSLPTWLLDITNAMATIVSVGPSLDEAIERVDRSGFAEASNALASQLRLRHEALVTRRNDARVLVSLYSLTLFLGLGYLGWRLNRSYRELNDLNEQLRLANQSLEERVEQRTRDVQKAYTDLQHSQVQLVQAEKMSSLGQLVAGISHEINTPLLYLQSNATINKETLGRINEFIELCHQCLLPTRGEGETKEQSRRRFIDGLKELQRALVDGDIREELREVMLLTEDNLEGLEELTQLAQGLKDFSRLDRAPVDTFDINSGVERTLVIAKNMLKTRINVITEFGDVPEITCAPSQINQVLLNLITNAAQAIESTGEIRIRTFVDGDFIVAQITDDGCGIDPEVLPKIRDPFFTTKEVGAGTGLGLSIVEEILGKHGGHLEIESEQGVGSTFSVYLPIDRPPAALEEALGESPATAVAEDEMPAAAAATPSTESGTEAHRATLALAPE